MMLRGLESPSDEGEEHVMTSGGRRTGQLDAWRSRFRRIATAMTTCHHDVKAKVRVHEYPDRTLAVFYGPRKLADYDAEGRLKEDKGKRAAWNRWARPACG